LISARERVIEIRRVGRLRRRAAPPVESGEPPDRL